MEGFPDMQHELWAKEDLGDSLRPGIVVLQCCEIAVRF